MTDKERLEMIKGIQKIIKKCQEKGQNVSNLHSDYVDWLIKQAEKVEQLQQENERLKKFLNWEQEEAQGLDEEVTFQLEQLKQAQAKIERYEKALEFYANKKNYDIKHLSENEHEIPVFKDCGEKARQALEGNK